MEDKNCLVGKDVNQKTTDCWSERDSKSSRCAKSRKYFSMVFCAKGAHQKHATARKDARAANARTDSSNVKLQKCGRKSRK